MPITSRLLKAKNSISLIAFAIVTLFLGGHFTAFGQSIVGEWKTIDDATKEPRSVVKIYLENDKLYGKVIQIFPKAGEDPDPICDKCSDHRKDQKIIGMQIINGLSKDGDEWEDGEILDPDNGKTYRCKLWLEDGLLQVRGYLLFFFRTQTWHRI